MFNSKFQTMITSRLLIAGLVIAVTISIADSQPKNSVPAFPGAEGFGAYSKGGRGGAVFYVTNLNDKGPGSLRAACRKKGPRTVLFTVSGTIELKSTLTITEPYLTIAGQTAPGDGICIKNYAVVVEKTHDVILRYLRVRPGDPMKVEQDAISVMQSQNVIVR
jgi:pectate lyase